MTELIRRIYKGIVTASAFLNRIASVVLVGLILLVLSNVIMRSFGGAIMGVYDLTIVLITVVISLAIAFCGANDGHVSIELLVSRFPKKVQKIVDGAMYAVALFFFVLATVGAWKHAIEMAKNTEVTPTVHIPYAPFIVILTIGVGMLSVVIFGKIIILFDSGLELDLNKEGE